MSIRPLAELSSKLRSNELHAVRGEPRSAVKLIGRLRERGHTALDTEIHDLSLHGFQADTIYSMQPGTVVWLQIVGLTPLAARVRWFRSHRVGCSFDEALHPAVYERILASAACR